MRTEILRELLERADKEPLGLRVRTNMTNPMVNQLSEVRTALGLTHLMIARPSEPDWVFIVHKSAELEV